MTDTAAHAASEGAYSQSETTGEDSRVEFAGFGIVGGDTGGWVMGEDFTLCIVNQGLVMALFPEVHTLGETIVNVLGVTNTRGCLENGCGEDFRAFRVPESGTDTAEFLGQEGDETTSDFAGGDLVASGG